jgi:hypothetical protein
MWGLGNCGVWMWGVGMGDIENVGILRMRSVGIGEHGCGWELGSMDEGIEVSEVARNLTDGRNLTTWAFFFFAYRYSIRHATCYVLTNTLHSTLYTVPVLR